MPEGPISVPSVVFVDLQYDFTREGGICYVPRPSVPFVRQVLLPFVRDHGVRCFEIVSDYRQPRKGDPRDCCRPGEWGYTSEVPEEALSGRRWVKSMNSPLWVREGIGIGSENPGQPYQDPAGFDDWLRSTIGSSPSTVVLAGLSLDACVLCTAQELAFRGYDVRVLKEGTDTRSGRQEEKERMISSPPVSFWSRPMDMEEFRAVFG